RVGERIKLYSINYKDIDLEFDIVGQLPEGRYNQSAVVNRDYLNDAIDDYEQRTGSPHPLAEKSLNLVWLRTEDMNKFTRLAEQVTSSPTFSQPALKIETASSGVSTFLEAYRDLLWGMRWLLAPAILVTLSLVMSNAISINVRERRLEMAVLKVLGFQPNQILAMVLGEALLVGTLSGLGSSLLTYTGINYYIGGIKFPIAFFPAFYIPTEALYWGAAVGALTAFFGAVVPAWSARTVRVSDVFSRIA
ncbi:MAG: ABC transporter permease, partial [Planctomycetia bacterium]